MTKATRPNISPSDGPVGKSSGGSPSSVVELSLENAVVKNIVDWRTHLKLWNLLINILWLVTFALFIPCGIVVFTMAMAIIISYFPFNKKVKIIKAW